MSVVVSEQFREILPLKTVYFVPLFSIFGPEAKLNPSLDHKNRDLSVFNPKSKFFQKEQENNWSIPFHSVLGLVTTVCSDK